MHVHYQIAALFVSVIFGHGTDDQCDTTDGDCQSGDPFNDVTTRDLHYRDCPYVYLENNQFKNVAMQNL